MFMVRVHKAFKKTHQRHPNILQKAEVELVKITLKNRKKQQGMNSIQVWMRCIQMQKKFMREIMM